MNNETVCNYMIKLRGDGVYDFYANNKWIASRGSYLGILDELKKYIESEELNESGENK